MSHKHKKHKKIKLSKKTISLIATAVTILLQPAQGGSDDERNEAEHVGTRVSSLTIASKLPTDPESAGTDPSRLHDNEGLTSEQNTPVPKNDIRVIEVTVDGKVAQICTAQITLPSNEIAYFGFEPILNKERSELWTYYKNRTDRLSKYAFGNVVTQLDKETTKDTVSRYYFKSHDERETTYFSLMNGMDASERRKKRDAFDGISSGCLGMNTDQGAFVAYISKNPIVGLCPLPAPTMIFNTPNTNDLEGHMKDCDHLIMSVSCYRKNDKESLYDQGGEFQNPRVSTENTYEHRGIFRNPMSFLRNDYKGIALTFHAFAASAWSRLFPGTRYMQVEPDGNTLMRELLVKSFGPEELKTKGGGITIELEALMSKFKS